MSVRVADSGATTRLPKRGMSFGLGETVLGWVAVIGSARGLSEVHLPVASLAVALQRIGESEPTGVRDDDAYFDLLWQLRSYMAGERVDFVARLDETLGTAFQRAVWMALREVPYGGVVTYGELAAMVGKGGAARAVGQAVGANPWPVIVPCHRVIAAGGKLGGFGNDLEMKRRLLNLEGVLL